MRVELEGQGTVDVSIVEGLHSEIDEALRILQGGTSAQRGKQLQQQLQQTQQQPPQQQHRHGEIEREEFSGERRVSPSREVHSTSLIRERHDRHDRHESVHDRHDSSVHDRHDRHERILERAGEAAELSSEADQVTPVRSSRTPAPVDHGEARAARLEQVVAALQQQVELLTSELAQTKHRVADLEAGARGRAARSPPQRRLAIEEHRGGPVQAYVRTTSPPTPVLMRGDSQRGRFRGDPALQSPPRRDTSLPRSYAVCTPPQECMSEGGGKYDWRASLRSSSAAQRRAKELELRLPGYIKHRGVMADVVDGGTVAVRRLDASSPLTAAQEYEFVVAVGADRVAAVRSDAHIAWLVEDTAKQLKHVAHPTPPRIKGPLRTGGMYPLVRAGPDMRSEILCRYSASIVDYYLAHPSVANVSLEVHSFASAAPPAEISFLMSAGAVDQAVPPQQSMAMSLSKRLTGGFLYPKRKQSVDEKQEESASRNALVSLMPFMRYIDDGTMERHHSAMMAGHIAFEADRRALSEAFQSFGRNLHEAGKAALWDPVSVPRPLQGVPRLPVPPHSDGTLSPKQVDSNRSGSGTSSPVVPAPSGMMATPRGTVFASKLRNREAMRARVNAQLVQKVSPTAAATHDDPNQSSPHTASNSPLASPPGASDAGSAPLCDTASTEAFIQALDTSGRGSTGQQAPVAYLATPRRPSSTVREPVGEGGRKASEPASGAVPDAQRFASCLHTLGHEHVRDALSPEEGAMQRHVGRPRSNSASDVIEVVAKGFEYLAKADEEEVTKHCSRCSLGGTLASNLFAGQLLKGARDVIKQPQSQVDDLQKLAEVRRVKAISDKVLGGTMQVFVENEIKRHSADARVFQHLLDVLDESVEEEDAPGGGDAFLASWNTELPSVGVRSPPTADDIISTATPSPTNENDGSVNVPRLDLSQAGFKATASRRPAEGTDISSDATSFVIVSDREKSA